MTRKAVPNPRGSGMALGPSAPRQVVVATDGSSLGNPGPAGWAWYADDDCWASGGLERATNQQAELFAVLAALRAVPRERVLLIRTDSEYTLKACTVWMRQWKARGWRKADGSPVMNLALMKELDLALADRGGKVAFEWVRGHAGDVLNENADARCTAAARAVRSAGPSRFGPGWAQGPTGRISVPPPSPAPSPGRGKGRGHRSGGASRQGPSK